MKKIIFLVGLVFLLSSCGDDEDDEPYYGGGYSYGVAYPTESNEALGFNILLDNIYGDDYRVLAIPQECDVDYATDSVERVYMYIELNEYLSDTVSINIENIVAITSYDAIVANTAALDTITNDPLYVALDGVNVTHTFMDITYGYHQGTTPKTHYIDLVCYPDSTDDEGRVMLKVQHSAGGDLEEASITDYKSFDLNTLPMFAAVTDSLNYVIKINRGEYNGVDYFEGTYYAPRVLE